jgi:integrase/recombinase XerD
MTDPSRTRVSGPLASFASGFADRLVRQGYTPHSAVSQMRLMAHVSRWLSDEGLDAHDLRDREVRRFVHARRTAGYTTLLTGKAMKPILRYLREQGAAPPPVPPTPDGPMEETLDRYRRFLLVERGVKDTTARGYLDAVRPFLYRRSPADGSHLDLKELGVADVTAFVVTRCSQQSCGSAKLTVTALRSFLEFLFVDGAIEHSLAGAVPSVARWRLSGLPKGLEPSQVRSLLTSCDRRTRKGRRDFAILTMLVRLGLRAGEVAALQLDDIDWRTAELVIHGKGCRAERLPIPSDVGEAVTAYLRRGRSASAEIRTVFVRVKAPHCALSSAGISQVVLVAARRAGLGDIHAHRLRHTAATQMLRAGAALPEIGQVLRHRRALTTAIYAKVDREALRTIARLWSGGVQ